MSDNTECWEELEIYSSDPQVLCRKLAARCLNCAKKAGVERIISCYTSFKILTDESFVSVDTADDAGFEVDFELFGAVRDFSKSELEHIKKVTGKTTSASRELELLMSDVHQIFKLVGRTSGLASIFKSSEGRKHIMLDQITLDLCENDCGYLMIAVDKQKLEVKAQA